MRTLRLITFCLLATVTFAPRALADVSAEERSKAFAWFDSLGYPDVVHLPLVKVYNGYWTADDFPKRTPTYEYGFLTQSDSKRFSICTLTLGTDTFTVGPATKEKARVYFEPVDLQTYARSRIKLLTSSGLKTVEFRFTPVYHGLPIELFVLARTCEGNSLSDLATHLCDLSETHMKSLRRDEPVLSFTEGIDDLISLDRMERIVGDYGDPKITRAAMLSQIDSFLEHFPSSRYHALAVDTQTELKRMVAEDREHAADPASPSERVSLKNRIPELIYDLRDQIGRREISPGECDVFLDPRGEKSPGSQLVEISVSFSREDCNRLQEPSSTLRTRVMFETKTTRVINALYFQN